MDEKYKPSPTITRFLDHLFNLDGSRKSMHGKLGFQKAHRMRNADFLEAALKEGLVEPSSRERALWTIKNLRS